MSGVRHSSFGSPHPQDADADARLRMEEPHPYPTVGEVMSQIARVIAVCLGLGLLARVLVGFVGMH